MNKGVAKRPRPRPPKGFKTWLDCAVVTMDTRSAWLYQPDVPQHWTRGQMRIAVADELRHLRALAGVPDTLRPDDPEDLEPMEPMEGVANPPKPSRRYTQAEADAMLAASKDAPGYPLVRLLILHNTEKPPRKTLRKTPKKAP